MCVCVYVFKGVCVCMHAFVHMYLYTYVHKCVFVILFATWNQYHMGLGDPYERHISMCSE